MYLDWPATATFALGVGAGIVLTLGATWPMLRKAWSAYQRERDYETATRVAEILGDIKHTQDTASEPDPARQRDVAEAALFKFDRMRAEVETIRDWMAHVAAGGRADDPPSKWMKAGTK